MQTRTEIFLLVLTDCLFVHAQDQFVECPNTMIFRQNDGKYVTVPTTTPGAYRLEHCNCSGAASGGGFEASQYSQSLFGCVACEDGFFAGPGDTQCQRCPPGTYSSQQKNLVNYRACYERDSPRLVFGSLFLGPSVPCNYTSASRISSGAASCTKCPAHRPYTWGDFAKSVDDCKTCPQNHFFNSRLNTCQMCSAACDNKAAGLYESVPCTEYADRQCSICDYGSCDLANGEYIDWDRGCTVDADRPCAPCTSKPERNSVYVHPSDEALQSGIQCTWQCEWGYYARAGESSECVPCSGFTSANCGPGFKLQPCNTLQNVDASCSEPCDPDAYGKPVGNETSEWVWTTYSDRNDGTIVENPTGGLDGRPNVGCMWRCRDGYVRQTIIEGLVYMCARKFF